MNYLNCRERITPQETKHAAAFFSGLSAEHAELLLESGRLNEFFCHELEGFKERFLSLRQSYSSGAADTSRREALYGQNRKFTEMLERLKTEASGDPFFRQEVFHIICEQKYIGAAFGMRQNPTGLISVAFGLLPPFPLTCLCNQMYFWGGAAAGHAASLLCREEFKAVINADTSKRLSELSGRFSALCFEIASMKPPLKAPATSELFRRFDKANDEFLGFLLHAKSGSPAVYGRSPAGRLPSVFYIKLQHITSEHRYIKTLCEEAGRYLKI